MSNAGIRRGRVVAKTQKAETVREAELRHAPLHGFAHGSASLEVVSQDGNVAVVPRATSNFALDELPDALDLQTWPVRATTGKASGSSSDRRRAALASSRTGAGSSTPS